jgi:CBS domain-containing protein
MRVDKLMSQNVQTIASDASLQRAAECMAVLDIGALPVMENDKVVGIVTDRDLVVRGISKNFDPGDRPVRDVMSTETISIPVDQSAEVAVELMREKQIRRLLVRDANDKLIGIVTIGDLASRAGDASLVAEATIGVAQP